MANVTVFYKKKKAKKWKSFGQLKLIQLPRSGEYLPFSVKKNNGSVTSHLLKVAAVIHIPQGDDDIGNDENRALCNVYAIDAGKKSAYLKRLANIADDDL